MNNLQALIAEWRALAKLQEDKYTAILAVSGDAEAYIASSAAFGRCADDLERALNDQPPGARGRDE